MGNFYLDVLSKDPRFHTTQQVNDAALLEPVTRAAVQGGLAYLAAHNIIAEDRCEHILSGVPQ